MKLEEVEGMRNLFPEVKFNDNDPLCQILKCHEEVDEAAVEYYFGNREKALIETVDVLTVAMNSLYKAKYTSNEILEAISYVRFKNDKRGYYK